MLIHAQGVRITIMIATFFLYACTCFTHLGFVAAAAVASRGVEPVGGGIFHRERDWLVRPEGVRHGDEAAREAPHRPFKLDRLLLRRTALFYL